MNSHPIVTTAHDLQPLIRQHLVEGEQRARLTNEVVTAVGQAGLFRLYAPQEVGGLEVPPPVALAAIEAVSAADPAVGWYMLNSIPACLAAASLSESARASLKAQSRQYVPAIVVQLRIYSWCLEWSGLLKRPRAASASSRNQTTNTLANWPRGLTYLSVLQSWTRARIAEIAFSRASTFSARQARGVNFFEMRPVSASNSHRPTFSERNKPKCALAAATNFAGRTTIERSQKWR